MTPERWQRVKDVLSSAMELAADERTAFLDRECANDVSLRSEVESLLDAADGSDSLPSAFSPGIVPYLMDARFNHAPI